MSNAESAQLDSILSGTWLSLTQRCPGQCSALFRPLIVTFKFEYTSTTGYYASFMCFFKKLWSQVSKRLKFCFDINSSCDWNFDIPSILSTFSFTLRQFMLTSNRLPLISNWATSWALNWRTCKVCKWRHLLCRLKKVKKLKCFS